VSSSIGSMSQGSPNLNLGVRNSANLKKFVEVRSGSVTLYLSFFFLLSRRFGYGLTLVFVSSIARVISASVYLCISCQVRWFFLFANKPCDLRFK
jgi:hypothetical protein